MSASNTGSGSASNIPSSTGQSSAPASSTTLSIPQTAAVGTLSITLPPQTATSYYKIAAGQDITFGWTTSDIIATPTSLTISAVCDNRNTYPVGIVPGTSTTVVWDVNAYQTGTAGLATPLVQGACTLHIWDERGPDATRQGGFLLPNSALKFALYTPQGYTPLASGWTCSACNSALSGAVFHPAFYSVVVAFLVIFLSGFGLLRRTFTQGH
ncbi:hypothetical protein C8J56DRAFT_1000489 [Mycena floridula]|nr:hypothetical protein C8J56DRAFT_1000489 [Mycena floridula]